MSLHNNNDKIYAGMKPAPYQIKISKHYVRYFSFHSAYYLHIPNSNKSEVMHVERDFRVCAKSSKSDHIQYRFKLESTISYIVS